AAVQRTEHAHHEHGQALQLGPQELALA
ncbi:MAG: NADH-ubiquinone oxidoreductase chain B, partial [uncultured Rubrobacteraceae bacterium]